MEHIKHMFLATVQISDMRSVGSCFMCWLADFGLTSLSLVNYTLLRDSYRQTYTRELTLILTFPFMNRSQAYSSKFSKLCVGFSAARLTLNSIGHMFYWLAGCRG